MADEIALSEKRARGLRAQRLLDDETLTAAFAQIETDYIRAWRETASDDVDGRERLHIALSIVQRVKEHLGAVAANGRLAEHDLASIAQRNKRFGF